MFGSAGREDSGFSAEAAGASSVYVITDDPEAADARAVAGGAEITREMEDADYGSRGFTVRDPEGNLFSFGTYRPAATVPSGPHSLWRSLRSSRTAAAHKLPRRVRR